MPFFLHIKYKNLLALTTEEGNNKDKSFISNFLLCLNIAVLFPT